MARPLPEQITVGGVVDLRSSDVDADLRAASQEVLWALARELPGRPWAIYDRHGRLVASWAEGASVGVGDGCAEIELGGEGHVLVISDGSRDVDREAVAAVAARVVARLFGSVLASKRQVREAESEAAWAWSVAHTDPVARVLNARGWWHELGHRSWSGSTSPVVVARLQLTNLRELNERRGHEHGDHVLRLLGERLVSQLPSTDLVARLGGGDFAVLAYATDVDTLRARLDAVLDLEDASFRAGFAAHAAGEPIRTTVARADLDLRS